MVGRPLVCQWEGVRAVFNEPNWTDLILEHHAELSAFPGEKLDPDYARYVAANDIGTFRAWTARHDGRLVGYIGWWVQPHPHFRTVQFAIDDLYLLTPEFRQGLNGYNMFRSCFAALKESGVKLIMVHSRTSLDLSKLMGRLGLEQLDVVWGGRL